MLSKGSGSTPASSPSEGSPEKGKQKRKQVGVATKVLMVKDVSAGMAVHEAADKWGVKIKTAYGIWKKRDSLLSCLEGSSHFAARKRLTSGRYPLLDAAVSTFANRIRELRLPLSFGLLQAECKKQAVAMGMTGFSGSAGWVSRWLKRSGFGGFLRLHGEGGSVDEDLIAEEMERVRSELAPFHPDNIYNEDESGFTYQCLPTGTYLSPEESYKTARGTKAMKNKARITYAVCCNATGSHILPPFFIGKSAVPVCFVDADAEERRLYQSSSKAWMVSFLFEHWLTLVWYPEVTARSLGPWALLLDNCSAHGKLLQLSGVTYVFLPPNVTAQHQPMDRGFIAGNKTRARSDMLSQTADSWTNRDERLAQARLRKRGACGLAYGKLPHVLDAIRMINRAVAHVTQQQAARYWLSARVLSVEQAVYVRSAAGLPPPEGDCTPGPDATGSEPWQCDVFVVRGTVPTEGTGTASAAACALPTDDDGVFFVGGVGDGVERAGGIDQCEVREVDGLACVEADEEDSAAGVARMAALLARIPGADADGSASENEASASDTGTEGSTDSEGSDLVVVAGAPPVLSSAMGCETRVENWLQDVSEYERNASQLAALPDEEYDLAVRELL